MLRANAPKFCNPCPARVSTFSYKTKQSSKPLSSKHSKNKMRLPWLSAVTSPITLSECLVYPYRLGLTELQEDFIDLIVSGVNVEFIQIDELIAKQASQLRAKYNLALLDSLQISVAIVAKCDVFLTNDIQLKRVTELPILVLSDLLAGGKNG